MILVEIRASGAKTTTIAVHAGVTVLGGLDAAARAAWAGGLARALRGEDGVLEVEVEVDGKRQPLTKELATRLRLDGSAQVTLVPSDLPGAAAAARVEEPAPAPAPSPSTTTPLDELRRQLTEARRAADEATTELDKAKAAVGDAAAARIPELEASLEAARTRTADARRKLADAETLVARQVEEHAAEQSEARSAIDRLQSERTKLEADRTELVGRMIETGDPGDPKPVEDALSGLRRLQSVKPKPSARALELADEWTAAAARLAALPQPPQPPEWLVAPALEALQEARDAVAAVEAGSDALDIDPAHVAALDRTHREVLEAEQRTMKKSSRANRKRLESAHEAERTTLSALGVASYGEYLQRVAPNVQNGGASREDRLGEAKAALADAEAVWEELHGGQASPEWTEAKQRQAAIRQEAIELLGAEVGDAELAAGLRAHLETVVDTGWAEQALEKALRGAGANLADDTDLEAEAERWLASTPAQREARVALEAELSALDERLAAVEEQLAERQANTFFGDDEAPRPAEAIAGPTPVDTLRARLADAEAAERQAEAMLQRLRFEAAAAETKKTVVSALEQTATKRGADVERLIAELAAAESTAAESTAAGRDRAEGPGTAPVPLAGSGYDLGAVVGMEAEAYLLARVAALRGATGGPLPMVIVGDALTDLSERAAKRVFRLLGRLADSMQLVVLGDGGEIATWAEGLGDRAVVRTVAR